VKLNLRAPLWLYVALLFLIILNGYTIFGTPALIGDYAALSVPFSPFVRIGVALVWIALFAVMLIGLFTKRHLAYRAVALLLTAYGLFNIIWDVIFARSDYTRGAFGFQIVITALVLIPIWWLAVRRGWLAWKRSSSAHGKNSAGV